MKYPLSFNNTRQRIYERMSDEWGLEYNLKLMKLLGALLGRSEDAPFLVGETLDGEEARLCELLLSENGYSIYKMLLAKRGLSDG